MIGYSPNNRCDEYASVWHWRRKAAGDARNGMSGVARRSGAVNARRKQRGRRDERADAAAQALVTAGMSLRHRAGVVFTENTAIRHSDTRNSRSARSIWRIFGWWRKRFVHRRCRSQHGFCGHGWHTWKRDRRIRCWCCFCPLPPLARFAAVQDDAAVFGHARPAGLDAVLLQKFCN
jgi:hypothetical protein